VTDQPGFVSPGGDGDEQLVLPDAVCSGQSRLVSEDLSEKQQRTVGHP
jgi:hypothetical protein